jgi:hypothetical protein
VIQPLDEDRAHGADTQERIVEQRDDRGHGCREHVHGRARQHRIERRDDALVVLQFASAATGDAGVMMVLAGVAMGDRRVMPVLVRRLVQVHARRERQEGNGTSRGERNQSVAAGPQTHLDVAAGLQARIGKPVQHLTAIVV